MPNNTKAILAKNSSKIGNHPMNDVDVLAKKIWNYLHINHDIQKADCILVFGSEDSLPAHRGCDLFLQNYAPIIIFSGNNKNEEVISRPEAEIYSDIALERGVPKEAIFIENKSFNTGQNTLFSRELIQKGNIPQFLALSMILLRK